jgi:UDP-N-acetylglucosamine 2-epimerase (non-hydrolysing)
VICVAGTRPNFVKVAPLLRAISGNPRMTGTYVHTGQHYDDAMSAVFVEQLGLPAPDFELAVGSGSHAAQTALIMARFEAVLTQVQPHVVMVVGDVNSTVACALAAAKFTLDRPFSWTIDRSLRRRPIVAHVEAGLRSGDLDMPEEINRRVTDAVADVLFTTEASADANLTREGVDSARVHFVGNVMIDSLAPLAHRRDTSGQRIGVPDRGYLLLTLHRPDNVDDPERLAALLTAVAAGSGDLPVVFPVHPRTRARLDALAGQLVAPKWRVIEACGYVEFIGLMAHAAIVCTDSGGVQEESTVLCVPCVTLRDSTERPVTITHGSNRLAGTEPVAIAAVIRSTLAAPPEHRAPPPLWDGHAAPRIIAVIDSLVP